MVFKNLLPIINVKQLMRSLLYIRTNRNNGRSGLLHYGIILEGRFLIWRRRAVSITQGKKRCYEAPGTVNAHYS